MNIRNILKGYEVEERRKSIDGVDYSFFVASYVRKDIFIAKYYILDIIDSLVYHQCEERWKDIKLFENFERGLLEDDFFESEGDCRFNLYLVLVVSENSRFLYDAALRNDFKYARKVILIESQLEDFFNNLSLKREYTPYFSRREEPREIVDKLKEMKNEIENILNDEMTKYVQSIIHNKRTNASMINSKLSQALNLYSQLNNVIDKDADVATKNQKLSVSKYRIRMIKKVTIENYRLLKERTEIPFGAVNVFYGDNGVGKTTLLEAIEYGITGMNRQNRNEKRNKCKISVDCINDKGISVPLQSDWDYMSLAEDWYGVKAESREAFNKMFNQYNYFDTSFASAFAIEKQRQVNLLQLQEFLGTDKIENGEKLIRSLYELLEEISYQNLDSLLKKTPHGLGKILSPESVSLNVQKCRNGLTRLREEIEVISLEDILNAHIKKIEGIFKLLIASNEYERLKVVDGEIVAIRSCDGKDISMVNMSTGQKVCLALAFMFDLFLSNSKAPNVIMLDEPAANLDDLHMLNLLDILRKLALSGTQIFFTTANLRVAHLFRRKFSFLEDEFRYFTITESEQKFKANYSVYNASEENPRKVVSIS